MSTKNVVLRVGIKFCPDLSFEEKLKQEINDYLDYYNNYRYKWDLNKMTPVEYRIYLLEGGQSLLNKIIKAESITVQSASL